MYETRISTLELNEQGRSEIFSNLIDGYETTQRENLTMMESKLTIRFDKAGHEQLTSVYETINSSMKNHRSDFENLIKQLGRNIQQALVQTQENNHNEIEKSSAKSE